MPISEARGRSRRGEPEDRPQRARLFLALDPDAATRSAIADWRDEALSGREELRLPAAESLHLTLAFLGSRSPELIPEVALVALGAVAGLTAPLLVARGVVGVPRRRPRLLALDLGDPEARAAAVQEAVVEALAAREMHAPEERPFWPHLTLGRVRHARASSRGRGVEVPSQPDPPSGELVFDTVALYRSHLSPAGAHYEALERRALVAPG